MFSSDLLVYCFSIYILTLLWNFCFILIESQFFVQENIVIKKDSLWIFSLIIYNVHCFYSPGILHSHFNDVPKYENPFNDVSKLCFI